MTLRRAVKSLLALFRAARLDRELDDEIRAHLELAERDALARGLPPEEARRAARLSFGGVARIREEHRDRRSARWIETLLRDVRYGFASLPRTPGFTAVVTGVLALGVGANVAMFSIVDAVFLKPLPFPEPDRIVRVWEAPRPGVTNNTTTPDFLEWKRQAPEFAALAAEDDIAAALGGRGDPVRLPGKVVTAEYFQVFGVRAALGRTFRPEDAGPLVVLSHAAWQDHFAGDPGILQHRAVLNGEPHQIIGVLAPGAFDRDDTKFWKPLVFTSEHQSKVMHWLTVHGRLRQSVSLAQVRERMRAINAALVTSKPVDDREGTVEVKPLSRVLVGRNLERSIPIVFGAVGLVLLIACANVAGLLLAKGATRTREMAVRAALGAGRGRLFTQLLAETLALCVLGGVAGVALAWLLVEAAGPALAETLPFTAQVSVDWRALCFAGALALGACLLTGAVPALQTSFANLASALNRSGRGSSGDRSRIRRVIVAGEVALSLVLVSGALLLLRSLVNLQRIDTGVEIEKVVTMSTDLPERAYPTPQHAAVFYRAVAERLGSAPGVERVGLATHLPLNWIGNGEGIEIAGVSKLVRVRFKRVDPGYFSALGIPTLSGRGIESRDREGAPRIMVINQALATQLREVAGIDDPVGRVVRLSAPGYIQPGIRTPEVAIAGVIRSERVGPPGMPDFAVVYVPLAQFPAAGVKFLVRTRLDSASVMPAIREAVRQVDPNLPLTGVATMQQVHDRTLSSPSRLAWIFGVFAAVAALLTAIGLYGVLAHAVTQQRRAIGVRMALGARRRDVVSHVLGNALILIAAGLVAGALGAAALTRVMRGLLFEVSALDPFALGAACLSMALVGLLAAFLPASRAARVDPAATLRQDG